MKEDEDLVSYTQKKDYFQQLSRDSKVLPVPRSWSADEPSLTDEQTTSTTKSSKRSLSTSATLSETEQSLIREQSIPEHSSEFGEQSAELPTSGGPDEERRSSVIEEIPEFRERVEYFRRMSKEESVEDSVQSSSSSQFTPNTAKRIAGKIVVEVQKRALEQLTPTSDQEDEDSVFKMSKTSEQHKDTSQEEDGRLFFSLLI